MNKPRPYVPTHSVASAARVTTSTCVPNVVSGNCVGGPYIRLLRDLNRQEGLTIIMVTHNMDLVAPTDRVVRLVKGRVEGAIYPSAVLPLPAVGLHKPEERGASEEAQLHPSIDPRPATPHRMAQ